MKDIAKTRALVARHEGRVPHAYQDSLGYWTIGVGHLIDGRKGGKLPEHIIDAILDWDIMEVEKELAKALPWVIQLDAVRYAVLVDMAFNLGVPGLLAFAHTLAYVRAGAWPQAADAMLQSKWAGQVGPRAQRLAGMMRSGLWP